MDYQLLREEGLRHIRKLAGEIWTDHNTHDPGITILETLCYAITDLGYRCSMPTEDLLASDPGNRSGTSPDFYLAHEILPNRPFTINDFRKILIDLPGIRNAWLEISSDAEQPVFFDPVKKVLTYDTTDQPLKINGLYNVGIELSEHSELGDLNRNFLVLPLDVSGRQLNALILFPDRDLIGKEWSQAVTINLVGLTMAASSQDAFDFTAHTNVKINGKTTAEHFDLKVRILANAGRWADIETEVKNSVGARIQDTGADGLFPWFNRKMIFIRKQLERVIEVLHGYRNLGEDFYKISLIREQEIAVKGAIEVPLDTAAEDLLASIYFDIQSFIDPPIRFYTLSEMLAGHSPEEIFEGPLLDHGFIEDTNLEAFKSREGIFTSDLLQLILDTDGGKAKAIKGLKLSNYIDSMLISSDAANCLKLFQPSVYKPKLDVWKSDLTCTKNGIPITIDKELVVKKFQEKMKAAEPDKSESAGMLLKTPNGQDRHTGSYFSIQEQLPLTYGTGSYGLPEEASAERKALARQLKGYLLFFDQLFANFLAQLSNLKNIFSMDPSVGQTYFWQAIYGVPDSMFLVREFIKAQPSLTDKDALSAAWQLFKNDDNNNYNISLREIVEDQYTYLDRRNRFVDHLLSRFCEEFTDYSLLVLADNDQEIPVELIERKIAFLQEYLSLGSGRGTGFIIQGPGAEAWDTTNVTGLEKRVARLLGFDNYHRRNLTSPAFGFVEYYQEKDVDAIDEYRFRIRDDHNQIILSSTKAWKDLNEGIRVLYKVLDFATETANYKIFPSDDSQFFFNVYDDKSLIISRRIDLYADEALAQAEIDRVAAFMKEKFNGISLVPENGFHLIEHLLLRPRTHEGTGVNKIHDPLIHPVLDDYGLLTDEGKDPYSLRTTVVLPAESPMLGDPHFKNLAERMLHIETPAHIMPQIYFLDNVQLCHLEKAWKSWLELRVLPVPEGVTARRQHLKALRDALKNLRDAMEFIPLEPET